MSFFQVDDDFHGNRKTTDLVLDEGAVKGWAAIGLWCEAGSQCRKIGTDGVVDERRANLLAGGDRRAARASAALLVKHGLWHAPGHDCPKCPPVEPDTWLFHDWFQFGYGTGAAEREAVAKRKELRTPAIVEAVWARDTDAEGVPRCRYCGKKVSRPETGQRGGRRRGGDVGQLDHVDPTKAIGASNIALTCGDCNNRKGKRTPEQAGMTLRPAPPRLVAGSNADQTATKPRRSNDRSNVVNPAAVQAAPARVGVGYGGVSSGSDGVGFGEGAAGPAPAVEVAAPWGSPWRGHHGAPPSEDLIEQATCQAHGLPEPCRRCAAEPYAGGDG